MTDLERIRQFIFSFPIPVFARGMVGGLLTHDNIRRAYGAAGGEEGLREVFAAFVRIGKGEVQGAP